MLILVGAATYFEFVYYGPSTLYSVVLWIIVVPMLFSATVSGVRSHPLYQPLMYGGFIAIGTYSILTVNGSFSLVCLSSVGLSDCLPNFVTKTTPHAQDDSVRYARLLNGCFILNCVWQRGFQQSQIIIGHNSGTTAIEPSVKRTAHISAAGDI